LRPAGSALARRRCIVVRRGVPVAGSALARRRRIVVRRGMPVAGSALAYGGIEGRVRIAAAFHAGRFDHRTVVDPPRVTWGALRAYSDHKAPRIDVGRADLAMRY
jgi:hypothetical protein